MSDQQIKQGTQFKGHNGAITSIVCPAEGDFLFISGSRDNTAIAWKSEEDKITFSGHEGFVSVTASRDGRFVLTASHDKSLRLWKAETQEEVATFEDHTNEVQCCSFSADNRMIVSGARDNSIKIWNTLGDCKFTIDNAHSDGISCIAFSPNTSDPTIISGGDDNLIKVWTVGTCQTKLTLKGHKEAVTSISFAPDGSLAASGSEDGSLRMWELSGGSELFAIELDEPIKAVSFSPTRYWVCAATASGVRVVDLETKKPAAVLVDSSSCTALAWNPSGTILYVGYMDGTVRAWNVE